MIPGTADSNAISVNHGKIPGNETAYSDVNLQGELGSTMQSNAFPHFQTPQEGSAQMYATIQQMRSGGESPRSHLVTKWNKHYAENLQKKRDELAGKTA